MKTKIFLLNILTLVTLFTSVRGDVTETSGSGQINQGSTFKDATLTGTTQVTGTATLNGQLLGPANKVVTVATESDRYALTGSSVNPLDWVKVTAPDVSGYRNVYGVASLNGTSALANDLYWLHLGTFLLAPVNTVAPSLSGTAPYIGIPINSGTGTWTDFPTHYSFQWQKSSTGTSSWMNISTGTINSYTPVSDDFGSHLRCGVTGSNGAGVGGGIVFVGDSHDRVE